MAADPGIRAVLEKHQWTVGALCELYPEGKVCRLARSRLLVIAFRLKLVDKDRCVDVNIYGRQGIELALLLLVVVAVVVLVVHTVPCAATSQSRVVFFRRFHIEGQLSVWTGLADRGLCFGLL